MGLLLNNLATTIILEETQRAAGRVQTATGLRMCCPLPHHNEKTPSCYVNLSDASRPFGWVKCFGCGFSGSWNKLASEVGWKKITDGHSKQLLSLVPNLAGKFEQLKAEMFEAHVGNTMQDVDPRLQHTILFEPETDWRGIPVAYLKALGCKRIIETNRGTPYMVIPVSIDNSIVGTIHAKYRREYKKELMYINSKGSWTQTHGLLGYDFLPKIKRWRNYRILFLVEGPRDAMWMQSQGFPAIAILGTQNWSERKLDLIVGLRPELIVTLLDNDKAGRLAGNKICEDIKRRRLKHHQFKLPHRDVIRGQLALYQKDFKNLREDGKLDPAMLEIKHLRRIHAKMKALI